MSAFFNHFLTNQKCSFSGEKVHVKNAFDEKKLFILVKKI